MRTGDLRPRKDSWIPGFPTSCGQKHIWLLPSVCHFWTYNHLIDLSNGQLENLHLDKTTSWPLQLMAATLLHSSCMEPAIPGLPWSQDNEYRPSSPYVNLGENLGILRTWGLDFKDPKLHPLQDGKVIFRCNLVPTIVGIIDERNGG